MASTANQKKIVTAANKVRTITDTQYMVQLHLILRKTAAAQGTAAALKTVQRTTLTQQTVTDIPASVIKLWTTLHTVSRHVNTNPPYLPFLQKIHNISFLVHKFTSSQAHGSLVIQHSRHLAPYACSPHSQTSEVNLHHLAAFRTLIGNTKTALYPAQTFLQGAKLLALRRHHLHIMLMQSLTKGIHHTPSFPQRFLAFWLPILPPFLPFTCNVGSVLPVGSAATWPSKRSAINPGAW